MSRASTESVAGSRRSRWSAGRQERTGGALFLVPALAFITLVSIIPLFYGLVLSLFQWNITVSPEKSFVGLANYSRAFSDPGLGNSVLISLQFVVSSVAIQALVGMLLALAFVRGGTVRLRAFRTLLLIPLFITPVVAGILWRIIFNPDFGLLNYVLITLGLAPQSWLSHPDYALWAIIVTDIWKWIPFTTLCFMAGLSAQNPEYKEAATVDGASAWYVFWRITMPLMKPVIIVTLLLRFVDAFKVLESVYVMTYGGPGGSTELLSFFIYKMSMRFFWVGYACALAVLFVAFVFVLSFYWIRQRQKLELT